MYVRTYGHVITNFFRLDTLPNCLSYEATLTRAWCSAINLVRSVISGKSQIEALMY